MALDSCQPIVHGLLKIEEGGKEKEVLNWSRCTDKQRFDNKSIKKLHKWKMHKNSWTEQVFNTKYISTC